MKKLLITFLIVISAAIPAISADMSNQAKIYYNQGVDYFKLGQYDSAIKSFREAIATEPEYIDAYYNLGSILEYLKQDEAALTVFKQIIVRKPTDYDSVYKAAVLSVKTGQPDKAKQYLKIIPSSSTVYGDAIRLSRMIDAQSARAQEEAQAAALAEQERIEAESQAAAAKAEAEALAAAKTKNKKSKSAKKETNPNPEPAAETPPTQVTPAQPVSVMTYKNAVYENLPSPTGITVDSKGNVYIAGFSDNVIFKVLPDGTRRIYSKDAKIQGPIGLAADSDDNLYIANYNTDNILKITPAGEASVLLSDVKKPYCLYIIENILFVSSQGSNNVIKFMLK